MKLPRYWRPSKKKVCIALSSGAKDYLRFQAEMHDCTMTFWLNVLLMKMKTQKKDFDPNPYMPTNEELKALAIQGLSAQEIERYRVTYFGSVKTPRRPKRRAKQVKF